MFNQLLQSVNMPLGRKFIDIINIAQSVPTQVFNHCSLSTLIIFQATIFTAKLVQFMIMVFDLCVCLCVCPYVHFTVYVLVYRDATTYATC